MTTGYYPHMKRLHKKDSQGGGHKNERMGKQAMAMGQLVTKGPSAIGRASLVFFLSLLHLPFLLPHRALFSLGTTSFVDSGFSCYSNRAASPASEPHWRHVHCRIHLRPSWRLPREPPLLEGGIWPYCWLLSSHTHSQSLLDNPLCPSQPPPLSIAPFRDMQGKT